MNPDRLSSHLRQSEKKRQPRNGKWNEVIQCLHTFICNIHMFLTITQRVPLCPLRLSPYPEDQTLTSQTSRKTTIQFIREILQHVLVWKGNSRLSDLHIIRYWLKLTFDVHFMWSLKKRTSDRIPHHEKRSRRTLCLAYFLVTRFRLPDTFPLPPTRPCFSSETFPLLV